MRIILEGLEYLQCIPIAQVEVQNQSIGLDVVHSHICFRDSVGFADNLKTGDLFKLVNQCTMQGDAVFRNVNTQRPGATRLSRYWQTAPSAHDRRCVHAGYIGRKPAWQQSVTAGNPAAIASESSPRFGVPPGRRTAPGSDS